MRDHGVSRRKARHLVHRFELCGLGEGRGGLRRAETVALVDRADHRRLALGAQQHHYNRHTGRDDHS